MQSNPAMDKPRVVIIDDDLTTQIFLAGILSPLGLDVESAEDGLSGFDLINEFKPRIVFCDILLPKIDGLQLCRKVRESAPVAETTIILMSAIYKNTSIQNTIYQSGADYFVDKPLDASRIRSLVEGILTTEGGA